MLFLALAWLAPWTVLGPNAMKTPRSVAPAEVFAVEEADFEGDTFATNPQDLGFVARSALTYLDVHEGKDPAASPGLFADLGVDIDRVKDTLQFVVEVAEQDRGKPEQRLQDPAFIEEHFEVYRWSADIEGAALRNVALDPGEIRLTRYLVYQTEGRAEPEGEYQHALYADPGEPWRTLSRQEVMGGVFRSGEGQDVARPLVWLTAEGVYNALMQGTIEVTLPSGATRLYNVAVNNGIPYDPMIKDPSKQARYWYFEKVDHIRGYGKSPAHRTLLKPHAAVAGDIYNLGLGKLVALEMGDTVRLAVLADTGGAFQPNLFQLDYLAGSYPSYTDFQRATSDIPPRVGAAVLLLKEPQG